MLGGEAHRHRAVITNPVPGVPGVPTSCSFSLQPEFGTPDSAN